MIYKRGKSELIPAITVELSEMYTRDLRIDNFVIETKDESKKWIQHSMQCIHEWRSVFRSSYVHWALAINGLHSAAQKYSDVEWQGNNMFYVESLRVGGDGKARPEKIVVWSGEQAADAHYETIAMLCSSAVIDLFSTLEDFIFNMYRVFLDNHPEVLFRHKEYEHLKQFHAERSSNAGTSRKWQRVWKESLNKWQQNKSYKGLGKVFSAYTKSAGLKIPKHTKSTTLETVSESIQGISILRNALVHNAEKVPKGLAEFSQKPHSLLFDFEEGQPLEVTLMHLQSIDLFNEQFLTFLNIALADLIHPDFSLLISRQFSAD